MKMCIYYQTSNSWGYVGNNFKLVSYSLHVFFFFFLGYNILCLFNSLFCSFRRMGSGPMLKTFFFWPYYLKFDLV